MDFEEIARYLTKKIENALHEFESDPEGPSESDVVMDVLASELSRIFRNKVKENE